MAVHAPAIPAPRHHEMRTAFLALGAIVGILVLLLAAAFLVPPSPTSAGVSTGLLETATIVDSHATAMSDHGKRLADAARASSDPQRDHWIADGDQMVADAQAMTALAARLRASARLLGDKPTQMPTLDLRTLSGEASSLISEGQVAIDHGKAMADHAQTMLDLARQPGSGISVADAQFMADDAPNVISAGQRVQQIGRSLKTFVDQMRQSLGQ